MSSLSLSAPAAFAAAQVPPTSVEEVALQTAASEATEFPAFLLQRTKLAQSTLQETRRDVEAAMWRSIVEKCADTPAYVTERLCVAAADVAEADGVVPLVARLGSSAGFRAFCAEACASLRLPRLVFRPCSADGFAEEKAAEVHVADFPLEQPVVTSTPVPSAVAARFIEQGRLATFLSMHSGEHQGGTEVLVAIKAIPK